MSKFLRFSRFLIALATSLHLFGLKGAVKSSTRSLGRLGKITQGASFAVDAAAYAHAEARSWEASNAAAETVAARQHKGFVAAAQAEANKLRRGFAVA